MLIRISKIAALFLAILLISGLSLSAAAEEVQSLPGREYSYRIETDGTAVITGYKGQAETLTVPGSLDGHQVTAIGDTAFAGSESLVSVALPEGLLSIGSNVFYACAGLSDVTLPEGLLKIDSFAFADCKSLQDITLPLSLAEMGGNPFAMTAVSIHLSPDHPRFEIIDGLLVDKAEKRLITYPYGSQAKEYTVPERILSIGDYAFYASTNLSAVTLPEGVVKLEEGAFYGCENLKVITLPLSLAEVELNPFVQAPASITLSPDHLRFEVIDGVLFDKVEKKLLVYPYGRETGAYTVPDGVLAIQEFAFNYCTNLTAITLPEGLLSIDNGAFFNCENLAGLTISQGLLSIGDNAFYNCGKLTAAKLPSSLTDIGFNPFELAPADITISPGHPKFEVIDGVLFDKSEHRLVTYPYGKEAGEYIVADDVLVIGDWSFSSSVNLTGITLPEGLSAIGTGAFSGCEGLTGVTLPKGLVSIAEDAFYACANLTELAVPSSVTAIGANAFTQCPNLSLTVEQGSFADTWAQENEVPYTYAEPPKQ